MAPSSEISFETPEEFETAEPFDVETFDVERQRFRAGRLPDGVSRERFSAIVATVHRLYMETQRVPAIQDIKQAMPKVMPAQLQKCIGTQEFIDAVHARGVPWLPGELEELTPKQMLAVQVISDPTQRTNLSNRLKKIGVTYPEYRSWLKQPVFARYIQRLTEDMLVEHTGDLHTALMGRALNGDLKAIEFVYTLNGRMDPNAKAVQDLEALIGSLIDIMTRHIKDPETLAKVQAEIALLLSVKGRGQTVRGEIGA